MNELQRCPGYKDRPEHMVPIDGFNDSDNYCKECRAKQYSKSNPKSNAIISLTEKYITSRIRRKHPRRKEMHDFARQVYNGNKPEEELKEFIQEIEAEAWLNIIFPAPPEDNLPAAKPSRKRISAEYDKPLPKEGWVYVMHTGLYNKIGKTWENGLRARRTEARRWGPADLVYWAWFDDAMAAEKEIHRRLKRYKVEKENVGEELFNCNVDTAKDEIKKLQEELEDYAREKQKVG